MIGKIEVAFLRIVLFLLAPYTWAKNKEIFDHANRLEQTSIITQTQIEFWILEKFSEQIMLRRV